MYDGKCDDTWWGERLQLRTGAKWLDTNIHYRYEQEQTRRKGGGPEEQKEVSNLGAIEGTEGRVNQGAGAGAGGAGGNVQLGRSQRRSRRSRRKSPIRRRSGEGAEGAGGRVQLGEGAGTEGVEKEDVGNLQRVNYPSGDAKQTPYTSTPHTTKH